MRATDNACDGCVFQSRSHNICNYLLVMDVRRGCPRGAECDKKMTKKEFYAMGLQKDWDRRAGKAMWAAGRGDSEIAKALGVTQGTISYYRRRHWERKCDAAPAEEDRTPVEEFPTSEPDTSADVEAPVCHVHKDAPGPVEIAIEVPEFEPEVTVYMPPSKEGPGAAKTVDVYTDHHQMILALEGATVNLTGMDAVMTAQIISSLWGWTDKRDLLEAKSCLDYLIRRHDHDR